MKIIKFLITLFFLVTAYWVTYLIFSRNFAHSGMEFSADNWNENTFMILIVSTGLSLVGVLCVGILSMFTHFVFIKLIYSEEIKRAAFFYMKNRQNKEKPELTEYHKNVRENELAKSPIKFKALKLISWIWK